jgi:uncharacterized protein YabE (DUF348 family)
MKLLLRKSTTSFGAIAAILALVLFSVVLIVATRAHAFDNSGQSGRLLTIHDRGTEKVILSEAPTVEAALSEAGITLAKQDIVEPAASEKLVAQEYQINIYRARPVLVVDGSVKQWVTSAYQTADQIVGDVGIKLYPEDMTKLTQTSDIVADGAGLQLTIDRAVPFNFTLFGKTIEARTQGETVKDMLKEKKITLGKDDMVSVDLATRITPGVEIKVWREGKQTITVDEPVAFAVQQVRDADRDVSYHAIQTAGKNGSRSVTYEIEIRDGVEVKRTEIASLTLTQATTQVEIIGSKLSTPTNPTENQAVGHQMMLDAGFAEDQWACLYNLWMHESGWRTNAGNPSSGAYGIPQALPASKMASYGSDYLTNARTQIAWGLNYIGGRYSTPCGAFGHWQDYNWY